MSSASVNAESPIGGAKEARLDFLYVATGAMGTIGTAAHLWPFIDSSTVPLTGSGSRRAVFDANCAQCHGMRGVGTNLGLPLVHDITIPGITSTRLSSMQCRRACGSTTALRRCVCAATSDRPATARDRALCARATGRERHRVQATSDVNMN
ncbi:MAG: ubiquinol-cytochrome c reductase iron-sulfur subunit N-terminal domain-containing protein [Alphaproteobacteria bacterium]